MPKYIQLNDSPSGNTYKVIHEGEDYYLYSVSNEDSLYSTWKVKKSDVKEVKRPIKAGDKVRVIAHKDCIDRDVLHIHHKDPDRRFVVVAFKSDKPESYYEFELELVED